MQRFASDDRTIPDIGCGTYSSSISFRNSWLSFFLTLFHMQAACHLQRIENTVLIPPESRGTLGKVTNFQQT